jgi:hypothetical protein
MAAGKNMQVVLDLIKALDLPSRLGWITFIVGASALVFIHNEIWPFASWRLITAPVAAHLTLIGAAVVAVTFLAFVVDKIDGGFSRWRQPSSRRTSSISASARDRWPHHLAADRPERLGQPRVEAICRATAPST